MQLTVIRQLKSLLQTIPAVAAALALLLLAGAAHADFGIYCAARAEH